MKTALFYGNAILFAGLIGWALIDQATHPVLVDIVRVPADYVITEDAQDRDVTAFEGTADEAEFAAEQGTEPALLPLHAEAREAFRNGKTSKAIALISEAIAHAPTTLALLNDLGVYRLNAGDLAGAKDAFEASIQQDPQYIRGYYNLGTTRAKQDNYRGAVEAFSKALTLNTHYSAARFNRALARMKLGDAKGAEQDYRSLVETDRSTTSAKAHYNLGVLLARQGGTRDAVAAFRGALRLRPEYINARYNVALLLSRLGRTTDAIDDYEKLLSLQPDHHAAGLNLGALLMREKLWEKAEDHFSILVERRPDDPKFVYNLALCRVQLGDDQGAADAFRAAVGIDPEYAEAHYNLALAYKRLGQIDPSVEHFARAAKLHSDNPAYHYNLALALSETDRADDAVAQYRAAVRLDPNYFRAYYNLALVEFKTGRFEEARGDFETAVQLRPDGYNANYNLGLTLLKLNDAVGAVPVFETTVSLDDTLEARYSLGLALSRSGRHRDAVLQYRAALKRDPKHTRSIERLAESLSALGKHSGAVSRLELLQKLDPADPSAFNIGLSLFRRELYKDAIAYFDVARTSTGTIRRKALNMRGAALARLGRPAEAIVSYRQALEESPHDGLITRNLARALELQGKHQLAIDELRGLQNYQPDNHLTSYLIGKQYQALGLRDEAAAEYRRALALAPDFEDARAALTALRENGASPR